jgi:catechol 2,3-dioxygenase-like lactoylglutathione lyase family enzyme
MTVKAGYSTPLLHAASVEDSIRFYELLGFELIDTDRCKPLGWARMHCESGAVMFLRAEHPPNPAEPTLLYMYTPELVTFRDQLLAAGVTVPPIKYPPYMPSGEITFYDPDGTRIFVAHWASTENDAWLKRIGKKPKPDTQI